MTEIRLNIKDAEQAIQGIIHGSLADVAIAALSAEPETISELEAAMQRFHKTVEDCRHFAWFRTGFVEERWDAGIVIIDLAARIAAAESFYSSLRLNGEVAYHDGTKPTNVWLSYYLPKDWLLLSSVDVYKSLCEGRRNERLTRLQIDSREILYGPALIQFIVNQCIDRSRTVDDRSDKDPIAEIHAQWLTTPRTDLLDETPRNVILERLDFIDRDMSSRQLQWSILGERPPQLASDSFAYRRAGFGTQEYIVYYCLVRHLVNSCWNRVHETSQIEVPEELTRLEAEMARWLETPNLEFDTRAPAEIIHSERRRIPMVVPAEEMLISADCELCRMLAEETDEANPTFWYLSGCNIEDEFVFSNYQDRTEWEEEQRRRLESMDELEDDDEFISTYREKCAEWEEEQRRPRKSMEEWEDDEFILSPQARAEWEEERRRLRKLIEEFQHEWAMEHPDDSKDDFDVEGETRSD